LSGSAGFSGETSQNTTSALKMKLFDVSDESPCVYLTVMKTFSGTKFNDNDTTTKTATITTVTTITIITTWKQQ